MLLGTGGLVACANFYGSFVRYPLHRLRGGTRREFRPASGFPVVGVVCLLFAVGCLRNHPMLMWTAVVLAVLDTSGPHWLAASLILMLVRRPERGDRA